MNPLGLKPLLALLHLSSPSLPVGGFAWSQGLESAIDLGWVKDQESLQLWVGGVLEEGVGQLDAPVFLRLYDAFQADDQAAANRWNSYLRANRETAELVQEEEALGDALRKLLISLNQTELSHWAQWPHKPGYLALFAFASCRGGIPADAALSGFLWSWLENQVMVACKTVPLGQTAAQKTLVGLMPVLELVVRRASEIEDKELGNTLPGLVMASAWHETQYSRLFRS